MKNHIVLYSKKGHTVLVHAPYVVNSLSKNVKYLVKSDKLAELLLYRDTYPVSYDVFRRDLARTIITVRCGHVKEGIDLNKTYEYIDTYNSHVTKTTRRRRNTNPRVSKSLPIKERLSLEIKESNQPLTKRVKISRLKALNILDSIMGRISKLTHNSILKAIDTKYNVSGKVDEVTKKADQWTMFAWVAIALIQEMITSLPDIGTALSKLFHIGDTNIQAEGATPENIDKATYNLYSEEEQNLDRLKFASEDKEYSDRIKELNTDYSIDEIAKGRWYERNLTEEINGKTVIKKGEKSKLAERVIGRANDLYKDSGLNSKVSSTDRLKDESDEAYLERAERTLSEAIRESESKAVRDREQRVETKILRKANRIKRDAESTIKVLEDSADNKNEWYLNPGKDETLDTYMYLEYRYNLDRYLESNPGASDLDKMSSVFNNNPRLYKAFNNTDSRVSDKTKLSLGTQRSGGKLVNVNYNYDKATITYENPDTGDILEEYDIENKSEHISEVTRAIASKREEITIDDYGSAHIEYHDALTEKYLPVNRSTNAIVYTTNINYESSTTGAK